MPDTPAAGSLVGSGHPNSPDAGHRVGLVVRSSHNEYSDGSSQDFLEVAWLPTELVAADSVYPLKAGAPTAPAAPLAVSGSADVADGVVPPPVYQ